MLFFNSLQNLARPPYNRALVLGVSQNGMNRLFFAADFGFVGWSLAASWQTALIDSHAIKTCGLFVRSPPDRLPSPTDDNWQRHPKKPSMSNGPMVQFA